MMIADDDNDAAIPEPRDYGSSLTMRTRSLLDAWERGDFDGTFVHMADDIVFCLYLDQDLLAFAGETVGKPAVLAAFTRMRQDWDYLARRTTHMVEEDDVVRLGLEYMYRHKASGEILSGNCRIVVRFRDCLVIRIDEYHDKALVETFMRLFGGQQPGDGG